MCSVIHSVGKLGRRELVAELIESNLFFCSRSKSHCDMLQWTFVWTDMLRDMIFRLRLHLDEVSDFINLIYHEDCRCPLYLSRALSLSWTVNSLSLSLEVISIKLKLIRPNSNMHNHHNIVAHFINITLHLSFCPCSKEIHLELVRF